MSQFQHFRPGKDPAYGRHGRSKCKNCGCLLKGIQRRNQHFVAIIKKMPSLNCFCSWVCYQAERKKIKEGAAERVKAFLEKKK